MKKTIWLRGEEAQKVLREAENKLREKQGLPSLEEVEAAKEPILNCNDCEMSLNYHDRELWCRIHRDVMLRIHNPEQADDCSSYIDDISISSPDWK